MSSIVIDRSQLLFALEARSHGTTYYLDRTNGEVIVVANNDLDDSPDAYAQNTERYVRIEAISSQNAFSIMCDFVDDLPNGASREWLEGALRRPKPFRGFKDALLHYPELRERWFTYHESAMLEYISEWLEYNEIEAEIGKSSG